MKQKLLFLLAMILLLSMSHLNAQVRITEAMSSAGGTGVAAIDWFEITNLGNTAVDITGWKVDDSSFAPASALALNGVTSIPAGKSVIFMETAAPATDIPALKAFWGSSMDNVAVGSYTGSGIGLSSGGDGIILFDNTATAPVEVTRLSFGAATAGSSFYWIYNASGVLTSTATGIVSTVGTINGTISNQVTLTSANSLGVYNIGSPGTAVVYPLGAGVNNPYYKNWFISGNKLKFDVLPTTDIEIFALTGSKLAVYDAVKEIELKLNKGIYMLRVDNKAYKFMINK